MNRKLLPLLCLAGSVVLMSACSMVPFHKSDKKAEPRKQAEEVKAEWGERKWEQYGSDNNGTTHYLDKSSITYPSRYTIHIWRKRVFPEAVVGSGTVRSSHKEIIGYDEMNCKTEEYRSLESQGVNWDGTTTKVFTRPTPWTPVYDGTADDVILRDYCKEAAKAAP